MLQIKFPHQDSHHSGKRGFTVCFRSAENWMVIPSVWIGGLLHFNKSSLEVNATMACCEWLQIAFPACKGTIHATKCDMVKSLTFLFSELQKKPLNSMALIFQIFYLRFVVRKYFQTVDLNKSITPPAFWPHHTSKSRGAKENLTKPLVLRDFSFL